MGQPDGKQAGVQNQEGGAGAAFIALVSLAPADASEHVFGGLSSPNLSPLPATRVGWHQPYHRTHVPRTPGTSEEQSFPSPGLAD